MFDCFESTGNGGANRVELVSRIDDAISECSDGLITIYRCIIRSFRELHGYTPSRRYHDNGTVTGCVASDAFSAQPSA